MKNSAYGRTLRSLEALSPKTTPAPKIGNHVIPAELDEMIGSILLELGKFSVNSAGIRFRQNCETAVGALSQA